MSQVDPPVPPSSSAPDPAPDPAPGGRGAWWGRWTLTPRAAVVLGAVVVAVALVVVAVGTLGARSSGEVTVSSGSARGGVPSGAGTGSARPTAEPGAPVSTGSPGPGVTASAGVVAVYVVGAVAHAGVVEVAAGTRVDDVLQRAGGATAEADLARLNLARSVVDGERLYVPRIGETEVPEALGPDVAGVAGGPVAGGSTGSAAGGGGAGGGGAGGPGASAVVDLNRADQATLETLPGIGPALAARILAWREEHGGFSSVDDLLEVSGIGDARLAELRARVRV